MALEYRRLGNQSEEENYLYDQTVQDKQNSNENSVLGNAIKFGLVAAGGFALYKSGVLSPIVSQLKRFGSDVANDSLDGYYTLHAFKKWADNPKVNEMTRPSNSLFNKHVGGKKFISSLWEDLTSSYYRGEFYNKNTRKILKDTKTDLDILHNVIQQETKGVSDFKIKSIKNTVAKEFGDNYENINDINQLVDAVSKKYGEQYKKVDLKGKNIQESFDELLNQVTAGEIAKAKADGRTNILNRRHSIKKSTLIKNIEDINYTMRSVQRNGSYANANDGTISNAILDEFVNKMTLTAEQKAQQLKESGTRQITLGDIFEGFDSDGKFIIKRQRDANGNIIKGANNEALLDETAERISKSINLDEILYGKHKSSQSIINDFFTGKVDGNSILKYKGKNVTSPVPLGMQSDIWKNIVIDEALEMDRKGRVINYMMSNRAKRSVLDALRKDFGLPIVGFNPFETIVRNTPLNNILNDRSTKFAFVSGDTYNAFITGKGTRNADTISEYLSKKFNKPDEHFNVLVSNNNAFAVGENGTFEQLEGKWKAYDITGVNKSYNLPIQVELFRQQGGYNLNKDDKLFNRHMTAEEYNKEFMIPNKGRPMNFEERMKYEIGRALDIGYQEFKEVRDQPYIDFSTATNFDEFMDNVNDTIMHSRLFQTNGFQYGTYDTVGQGIYKNIYAKLKKLSPEEWENLKNENSTTYKEIAAAVRDKTYETAFGNGFGKYVVNGKTYNSRNYIVTREGYSLKDLWNSSGTDKFVDNLKGLFGQYFSGFDKNYNAGKYYTEKSSIPFGVLNALDSGLSTIGLGLSQETKRSTGTLLKNLLLKRALPVYMLTQVPGMINAISEPFTTSKEEKEEGKRDNLGKTLMRDVVKPIDIGIHKASDKTGFTSMMKYLQEMIPGSDQFNEMPGIYQLGLGQTAEERKEYIEKGYDPIRKNRYWSASNTPFTGSKIDHWRPNIYRRVEADIKFSDSKYGSRWEYYSNTWYPNIINPFAPINYFLLDPNHYDKKHEKDRPYLKTAPKGENIPIIGPFVGGTVGQLYSHKMHDEYWENGQPKAVNPEDEKPSQMLQTGISDNNKDIRRGKVPEVTEEAFKNLETYNEIKNRNFIVRLLEKRQREEEIKRVQESIARGSTPDKYTNPEVTPLVYAKGISVQSLPYTKDKKVLSTAKEYPSKLQLRQYPRTYESSDTALDVYTSPSGEVQIVDVPENLNLYKVNQELKHYSINKIYGTNQRINMDDYTSEKVQEGNPKIKSEFAYAMGTGFNDLSDVAGLRGFMLQALLTGEANKDAAQIDTSSYAYSVNRSFWDTNLGGFGGELSEIARRFIHKKDKDTTWINPIRNTMPTWMPGSNYFTDFLHGDPYTKVMNGEERLPGEGYERLNNINLKDRMVVSTADLYKGIPQLVQQYTGQMQDKTFEESEAEKNANKTRSKYRNDEERMDIPDSRIAQIIEHIIARFKKDDILREHNIKFEDDKLNIHGQVDAVVTDYMSRTNKSLINIRPVSPEEFYKLSNQKNIRRQDYYEMNYDLYATDNQKSRGYIYYVNQESPDEIYKARMKFNKRDLRKSIENLEASRLEVNHGIESGEISRADLYTPIERYRVLADVAPYSQEFKDAASQIANMKLTAEQRREASAIRERMLEQKEPLRTYDYKFKTANLKSERVTVKKILDNNTFLVNEYGYDHAIKFAGIRVSTSNSELYGPSVKDRQIKNKETGRMRTEHTGLTMNEAARKILNKYIKEGKKITIEYDADPNNKFSKDSIQSIRAVVKVNGHNVNRILLNKGVAKENKKDETPAGINARYSPNDIAFGATMERINHLLANIPFVGNKFFQVRSPYEQYRKREVYNKDFQSWNHPIRDFLMPTIEEQSSQNPIFGIVTGAFIGSLFGRKPYSKLLGAFIGGSLPAIGQVVHAVGSTKDREWRPARRIKQEELNTYIDTLKYVKNTRLYNQYKERALKENNFDVDAYLADEEARGEANKERKKELENYKRKVKLDFKHRKQFKFKDDNVPKYETKGMDKKETVSAINREIQEISNDRKVSKLPLNAIKAIYYKQNADKTMYGYEPGDDLTNIMSALPKKERQYFSKFMKAPEEEKKKILRIAPEYLRRALQAAWGMPVDEKPSLQEYFKNHALPGERWAGWRENTDINDIKVKMVNQNNLDPGEFDIWTETKKKADKTNIPIPKLRVRNDPNKVRLQLEKLLNTNGVNDTQVYYTNDIGRSDKTEYEIQEDERPKVERQIQNLRVS